MSKVAGGREEENQNQKQKKKLWVQGFFCEDELLSAQPAITIE